MPLASPIIRLGLLATLAQCISPALAGGGDVFATLPGAWAGTGTVLKSDDTTENLRCKARYSLAPSGTVLHQELECAADSYRLNLVADLVNDSGRLRGTWRERDRQAGGSVIGQIEGEVITTRISGNGFEATVVIKTDGSRQTIALTSENGSYAKAVTIALRAR